MAMTAEDFVERLVAEVPETREIVRDHYEFCGELLLHILTADLRRMAIDSFERRHADVLTRLLDVVDRALREGADDVVNAVAVSFVEDTG